MLKVEVVNQTNLSTNRVKNVSFGGAMVYLQPVGGLGMWDGAYRCSQREASLNLVACDLPAVDASLGV